MTTEPTGHTEEQSPQQIPEGSLVYDRWYSHQELPCVKFRKATRSGDGQILNELAIETAGSNIDEALNAFALVMEKYGGHQ